MRKLAPETRAAAATAYADALERVNALVAEYAPSAVETLEAGSRRLASFRESMQQDVESIRERYVEAVERAGRGVTELRDEVRSLYRMRRAALKRARRRLRRLPSEYRVFGSLEMQALRRRLDELLPESAMAPA